MTLLRALRRLLRVLLLSLAAMVLFIEEWGWRPLAACVGRLARWPPLARLEAALQRVPPRWALVLFIVPAVMLFPVKLMALWLIHQGRAVLGLTVIVLAKVVGTALVGRLFVLTEPQLMQFRWFANAMGWWLATKQRVRLHVTSSAAWRTLQGMKRRLRVWARRVFR